MSLLFSTLRGIDWFRIGEECQKAAAAGIDGFVVELSDDLASHEYPSVGEFILAHIGAAVPTVLLAWYHARPDEGRIDRAIACGGDIICLPSASFSEALSARIAEQGALTCVEVIEYGVTHLPVPAQFVMGSPEIFSQSGNFRDVRWTLRSASTASVLSLPDDALRQVEFVVIDYSNDPDAVGALVSHVRRAVPADSPLQRAVPAGLPIPRSESLKHSVFTSFDAQVPARRVATNS